MLWLTLLEHNESFQHPRWSLILDMAVACLNFPRSLNVCQGALVLPLFSLAPRHPAVDDSDNVPGLGFVYKFQHHIEMVDGFVQHLFCHCNHSLGHTELNKVGYTELEPVFRVVGLNETLDEAEVGVAYIAPLRQGAQEGGGVGVRG